MLDQIQKAEEAIRNGDTRTGFEILRQVLAENPDSERAWWVMSGLVPKDQRSNCLIQVLRINPDNTLARETLYKLAEKPSDREPSSEKHRVGRYLTWPYSQRSKIILTLLGNETLITAVTEPKLLNKVRAAIKEDKFSPLLFKGRTQISLEDIIRIRQMQDTLQVIYRENNREKTLRLELENKAMADEILIELLKELGSDYAQTEKPGAMASSIGISAVLIMAAAGLTAFFYWAAKQASSGNIQVGGIFNLLGEIGSNGIALLGGILILIALGVSAWLLLKPPKLTEITRLRFPQSPEDSNPEP
jgi:hypothetical protein